MGCELSTRNLHQGLLAMGLISKEEAAPEHKFNVAPVRVPHPQRTHLRE